MKIAVIGAGAIGSILGGLLARAGEDVTLIARRLHADVINKDGLRIDGALGEMRVQVAATEKLAFRPDLAIVAVKTQDIVATLHEYESFLAGVPALMIQNGVQADQLAASVLGKENILSAVVLFGGTFLEPGKVTYLPAPAGKIMMGEAFGPRTERLRTLGEVINKAIPVVLTDDVPAGRWTKLIINETNAVPAITGRSLQEAVADPFLCELLVRLMREAVATIQASNIHFSSLPRVPRFLFTVVLRLPMPIAKIIPRMGARAFQGIPSLSSTLQSIMRGEPVEIDYLNGEIVRLGEQLHHPTPYNSLLVALVKRVAQRQAYLSSTQIKAEFETKPK